MKKIVFSAALFSAAILVGCGGGGCGGGGGGGEEVNPATGALKADIQVYVNTHCVKCHGAATANNKFVNLADLGLGKAPGQGQYVVAGCPKQSRMYIEIADGSMPLGGPKASAQTVTNVGLWISNIPGGTLCP